AHASLPGRFAPAVVLAWGLVLLGAHCPVCSASGLRSASRRGAAPRAVRFVVVSVSVRCARVATIAPTVRVPRFVTIAPTGRSSRDAPSPPLHRATRCDHVIVWMSSLSQRPCRAVRSHFLLRDVPRLLALRTAQRSRLLAHPASQRFASRWLSAARGADRACSRGSHRCGFLKCRALGSPDRVLPPHLHVLGTALMQAGMGHLVFVA